MIKKEGWSTNGLIPGRQPESRKIFSIDFFQGGSADGITYPKEKQYLNPDSEYRYKFLDILAEVKKHFSHGRILDVAAGPGHFSTWANRNDTPLQVVNLDISLPVLSWAKKTHNISKPVTGDAKSLPFRKNSFDGVLLLDVLEYLWPKQAQECVEASYQLLRSEGNIFIMIPNRISWDQKPKQYEGHVWLPTVGEMKSLLIHSGFNKDSIYSFTRGFPISDKWRQKKSNDLRLPYFGRSIFISASK